MKNNGFIAIAGRAAIIFRGGMLLLTALLLIACEKPAPDPTVRLSGSTMGTRYDLKLVPTPGQALPADLKTRVETLLAGINKVMSTYDPDSELSHFNRQASTDWIAVSPELQQVVAESLQISELSGGAFDITVGPLVNLWGFGPEPRRDQAPSEAAIAQARERVGYWRLHARAEPPALKKDRPDLYVDLSAIAKGYGVDQLAARVNSVGINDYLISIGGEVRAKGRNGKGQPWTIAIEQPVPDQRAVERLIRLGDHSISTSGDYRNFFEQDGRRYSHLINPHTGRPVLQTLASVTMIGNLSSQADATATALMAAGPEFGFRLATAHHLAAFFILVGPGGVLQERYTPEFEPYLLPQQP